MEYIFITSKKLFPRSCPLRPQKKMYYGTPDLGVVYIHEMSNLTSGISTIKVKHKLNNIFKYSTVSIHKFIILHFTFYIYFYV